MVHSNLYLLTVSFMISMTLTPPAGSTIRAVESLLVVETPKTATLQPRIATVYPVIAILAPFILGIIMTIAGIVLVGGLQTPGFDSIFGWGVTLLALGVFFLAVSFAGSRHLSIYLPEESTALALYVAAMFVTGAFLAFIGISNFLFDSGASDWSFVAVAVFGLLLVTASVLLYRRGFKQGMGKKKGI